MDAVSVATSRARQQGVESFLLLNLSHIGDVLFTTPAIRALKDAYPDSRITVVVGEGMQDVLKHNACVDSVVSRGEGIMRGLRLNRRLSSEDFTTSIAFSFSSMRMAVAGRRLGVGRQIGFDRSGITRFLTESVPFRADVHRVEAYLDLVRALGVEPKSLCTEMFAGEEDLASADRLLRTAGVDVSRPFVVFSPGSTVTLKQWFPERYAELSDRLMTDGRQVVLVGAAGERGTVDAVLAHTRLKPLDLCGNTSIAQLAAVLKRSALTIGNDSGPVHMSVAVGTPAVAIFGPTDAGVFGPYGPLGTVLWEKPDCYPCGYNKKCASECMSAVTVDMVYDAALGRLESQGARP